MNSERLIKALQESAVDDQERWAEDIWGGRTPDTSAFGQRLAAVMLLAMMDAAGEQVEVERHGLLDGLGRVFSTVFTEAMNALRSKPAIAALSPRQVEPALRQTAFFVSGVTAGNVIEEIKARMLKIREAGGTLQDFIASVRELNTGKTGSDLETVWRTNIASAAGAGRWQQMNRPSIVAFRYSSMNDEVARPLHAAMNGFIAAREDPIWKIVWRPAGYNCRCDIMPVSMADARSRGLLDDDSNLKQQRFFANPFQEEVVDAAEAGYAIIVDGKPMLFPDKGFRGNALIPR